MYRFLWNTRYICKVTQLDFMSAHQLFTDSRLSSPGRQRTLSFHGHQNEMGATFQATKYALRVRISLGFIFTFSPRHIHCRTEAGSFVNFVDANDVENDADLSFSGPDFRPNWFPLSVIGSYRRLSSLTLSEWEAFSHKNPVTSSRVRSNRSSSVSEKPP